MIRGLNLGVIGRVEIGNRFSGFRVTGSYGNR